MCINRRQVHPLIRFLLRSRVDERVDLHKAIHRSVWKLFWLASRCEQRCPCLQRFPWALQLKSRFPKRANHGRFVSFLKTPFWLCHLGCGRFLSSVDSHDRCLQCLGIQHAEAAFMDGLCIRCERVNMAALWLHLSLLTGMGGAPSVTTHAGFSAMSREPSASALGDLRVTVRAFPPGQSPRNFHSSCSSCSV